MKGLLSLFNGENIKKHVVQSCQRFPIPVSLAIALSILFWTLLHGNTLQTLEESIIQGTLSIIVTFFLSVGVTLYKESSQTSKLSQIILDVLPLVFGIIFFYGFFTDIDNFQNLIFFCITLCGVIALLFCSPYIRNILKGSGDSGVYYNFFYSMSVVFLMSAILGWVLFGLGSIAIGVVFTLFDIDISEKIFGDWAIVSLCIFTPIFALSQIPAKKSFGKSHFKENTFFSFLIKYVAIPFIFIYFFILYAYTIKVLLNFNDWPKGEVSWLVIGFSIFGYITYMFSQIFTETYTPARWFKTYFPFMVLPQVAMLFYAIALRIGQYDITTNRYFVVVFGVWLCVISLYLIISRRKHLGYIPAIITLFTIIISVGPWSVYNLPESRQLERLKANLEKANILQNNSIITSKIPTVTPELGGEIYDGIEYVCNLGDCKSITTLFSEQYKTLEQQHKEKYNNASETGIQHYHRKHTTKKQEYTPPSKWEIINHITESINVQRYYSDTTYTSRYLDYYVDYNDTIFPLEISNYNEMIRVTSHTRTDMQRKHIKINSRTATAFLYNGTELIGSQSIDTVIQQISHLSSGKQSSENLMFEVSGEIFSGKLILERINIPNPEYTKENIDDYYYGVEGYLLLP